MLVFRIYKMVSSNKHIKVHRLMHRIPIEETELVQASSQSDKLKLVLDFLPGAVHLVACRCLYLQKNPLKFKTHTLKSSPINLVSV
jgi:hypothetical protein